MKFLCLPILLCLWASAFAQSIFAPIISSVLDNSPELRSGELSIRAAEASASADNALDGPSLDFDYLWNSSEGPNRWSAGVSQDFEFPGAYAARREASRASSSAAMAVLAGVRADRALAVKEAIIDIVNTTRQLRYYEEVGSRIGHILQAVDKSYELGEATILDKRKMQLASLDNSRRLADLESQLDFLMSELRGMGASIPENVATMWDDYPLQKLEYPSPESDRLLYSIRDAKSASARAGMKALRLGALPKIALGYTHAYEDGVHFNGLTVGLTLPSWGSRKKARAAQLEALAADAEISGNIATVVAENEGLYLKAARLKDVIGQYADLSSDNSYLGLLSKAFDAGQLTVIDYLTEVNLFSEARLAMLDLQYQYNLTLARLNRYRSADF